MRSTPFICFAAGAALALAAERLADHRPHAPAAHAADAPSALADRLDDQQKVLGLVLQQSFEISRAVAGCAARGAAPDQPAAGEKIAPGPPGEVAVAPPDSPESAAALNEAQGLLQAAASSGRWTDRDRTALRERFGQMSPGSQSEFLRQFAMAVNQDRLKLDHPGPPF